MNEKEYLIGEESLSDAAASAERALEEAERCWQSGGWQVISQGRGVLVEAKPVSGAFERAGILLTRSRGEVNAPAQPIFDRLTSPEGYAIIDPFSDPNDHKKPPLESYPWRTNCRLEAALAVARMPVIADREFVVLNAIDPAARIFVSKSILHPACPGGSVYSNAGSPSSGRVRALNTFAIKVEARGDRQSLVLCLNYADMAGKTPASINNLINIRYFLQALHRRIGNALPRKSN